ncbi:unnamed protein product [Lactuca saligna]|uniref:Uncharacterized protein n=1 Tax=Lactuca saligna TaxID=75948 RepID=A0AA35Y4C8_LACSI|nr:unnamed protein product [Lactuca saligna]
MAGFCHDDPYFPNEGNIGRLEAESDDEHQIPLDDHQAEGFSDRSDSKPEVNNLPLVGQPPNNNPRPAFPDPTPLWANHLNRWSEEQGQPLPYFGDRSFHNVSNGGSADRALPVIIRRIARNVEQGRAAIDQVMEIEANSGVNTVRIRCLEEDMERTRRTNEPYSNIWLPLKLKSWNSELAKVLMSNTFKRWTVK